ncbi:hypothetical protein KFZ76_22605 [Methylovulum psychrotolerans]|uniref:hypothetical protein n=1 Tax=Methylovulum psychrotolerans TaxID=1704499 RepID=UPI001BFF6B95|nr:hypothetical protein [Methylovulum psychrotolerans]MBT9100494.1 hypothetical protein [Methylovulum psychrotolerans]
MGMTVVGSREKPALAIDSFDESYHSDYFSVRSLANEYLSAPLPIHKMAGSKKIVNSLACVLHVVLKRYGAERQNAPTRKNIPDFEKTLMDETVHSLLKFFWQNPLAILNSENGSRISTAPLADMDCKLIKILNLLADGLFTNNTNVTYPMKSLMLLTGYMPALDSQVKGGLHKANVSGVNSTQFLLPNKYSVAKLEVLKITRLPFILAGCYSQPCCKSI